MASFFGRQTEGCLAVRAFSVSQLFKVANSVLLKNEKAFYLFEKAHKLFVFAASFVNVSGKAAVDHEYEHAKLNQVKHSGNYGRTDENSYYPYKQKQGKKGVVQPVDAVSAVKETAQSVFEFHLVPLSFAHSKNTFKLNIL